MKALVLGGCGFIGSHIVDELLQLGHTVRVFDRSPEKFRNLSNDVDYIFAAFEDRSALERSLKGIDIVYHLISTTVPSTSNNDPAYDIESNLVSTINLLNLMREAKTSRIVYLSSGGTVYGVPKCTPIPETHSLNPICSYGVVKVAVENYLQMYKHLYGIDYIALRVSNPYGSRQSQAGIQGVIASFMSKIIKNENIEIWGDGTIIRDFIHVNDLAKLCVLSGDSYKTGVFNVGSGCGNSIKDIVAALKIVCGKELVKPCYTSQRSYDVPQIVLDIDKIQSNFLWRPKIELMEGIERTWAWMNEPKQISSD